MKKIILNANNGFVLYNFRFNLMKILENKGFKIICMAGIDSSVEDIKKNNWRFIDSNLDRRGTNI